MRLDQRRGRTLRAASLSVLLGTAGATGAQADAAIVRHLAGKFPIASAIEVPPGYDTIYLSGMGADIVDKTAKPMTLAAYGDTETQTASTLSRIAASLAGMGLTLGDIVQMHVFLVADPATGRMDFAGMMRAYAKRFGTPAQPLLPTRAAMQVAGLANPGWLVEIEVVAVRRHR